MTYDTAWHDRRAAMAEADAADPTIGTRLGFYINLIMSNPKSLASPYANARGILVNVCGLLDDEADHYIENEVIIRTRRNNR